MEAGNLILEEDFYRNEITEVKFKFYKLNID
jgi:hypothetical protein